MKAKKILTKSSYMIDEKAAKGMSRLYTLFACLFIFTPLVVFPILSYKFSDWWILVSIPCYFIGAVFYKVKLIINVIAVGLIVFWFINGLKITLPMCFFFAACFGCYAMTLVNKYKQLPLEYKIRFQEKL